MLTYRLQKRGFRAKSGTMTFPNEVRIAMTMAPSQPFGTSRGPGRTLNKGDTAKVTWDANNGRFIMTAGAGLAPVDVTVQHTNLVFRVIGDKVLLTTNCDSLTEVEETILGLYWLFPTLLNLDFVDPPVVIRVTGSVGDTEFSWEFLSDVHHMDVTTTPMQEERIVNAGQRLPLFNDSKNRRLAAALHYFHVACRLSAAGQSPWEVMAEIIFNFAKILQVLFGDQRGDVRQGLGRLGYSQSDVETILIPVMVLRDEFDVGHVMISILEESELHGLYKYLSGLESEFRKLLRLAVEAIEQ